MANTQNLDLVKPLGTDHALVSVLNSNSDKIDAYAGAVNASLDGLRDGLGILADGNTHAAITSGQFVYVKNHQTLPQGLYQATTNIAANGTLSTSNLTADPKGGLNTLSEQIGNIATPATYAQSTLDGLKNNLLNVISEMANGEVRNIVLRFTAGVEPFGGGQFKTELFKLSSSYVAGIAYSYKLDSTIEPVYIKYYEGTWLFTQFSTKQQSITSSTFTGTIYARRSGNVVVLNFYDFKVTNSSTTLQGIIPSDYRPSSGQTRGILQTWDSTKMVFISATTAGDISADNADTSKYYYGSITYII